jgi:taurine dioxygenase
MTTALQLKSRELKPGFGAELLDVDLATADRETQEAVVDAFHRHGAILLRGQTLDPAQLTEFIGRFGEAEDHTQTQFTLPGHPKVFVLSNRVEDGRPIGAHNDGIGWHTDYSYKAEPVMCTMLYAVEVPDEGSDTLLADQCAAWNALAPERQAELTPLVLHHSYQHFMETREYGRQTLSEELKRANPDVLHPLVRTHPADGRKALWVSTGTVKEVVGLPVQAGLDLIDELVEFVTQDRFVYRHKWAVGDVLVWDNRCTLHTGTLYDDTRFTRTMHRLWAKGDRPH